MKHEFLKVKYSCTTCAFFESEEPGSTKGTCHARPPVDDKFSEVDSTTGWCGGHATVEPGVVVPDVVGMLIPMAEATILEVESLLVGTITRVPNLLGASEESKNKVVTQEPVGGTPVAAYSKIDLTAMEKI